MMIKKREFRIYTLDDIKGPISFDYTKTPEELEAEEAELKRRYHTEDICQYLQFSCSYCGDPFFRMHPVRGRNMNPLSQGYFISPKQSKKITGICSKCMKELSDNNDCNFTFSSEGYPL
jgi:hypothetical protein